MLQHFLGIKHRFGEEQPEVAVFDLFFFIPTFIGFAHGGREILHGQASHARHMGRADRYTQAFAFRRRHGCQPGFHVPIHGVDLVFGSLIDIAENVLALALGKPAQVGLCHHAAL